MFLFLKIFSAVGVFIFSIEKNNAESVEKVSVYTHVPKLTARYFLNT
jgi:hypothetical protein